mmetsp:Transcript_6430/g.12287  ORF Transcript_6430/g.12287 Transcript_6430/m.12287 type:complete len:587 (-) Transcript_6430:21-1781(-)
MSLSMHKFALVLIFEAFAGLGEQMPSLHSGAHAERKTPLEFRTLEALATCLLALRPSHAFNPAGPRPLFAVNNFNLGGLGPARLNDQIHSAQNLYMSSSQLDESTPAAESPGVSEAVRPAAESFEALGVSPLLLPALDAAGIKQPTEIQSEAFGAILSGNDVVMLSETGSGKTLAYALPILQRLVELSDKDDTVEEDAETLPGPNRPRKTDQVLVLVPNKDLAVQVEGVFQKLIDSLPAEKKRFLRVSAVTSVFDGDPEAKIVVASPECALNYWKGAQRVRWVVLDESDALLAGSFKQAKRNKYPLERIIEAVRQSAKEESKYAYKADRLPASNNSLPTLPKNLTRGEVRRLQAAKRSSSKQFVLAGATMPNAGTKNVQEHVKKLFPYAKWIKASRVHQSVSEVKQYFVKIDPVHRREALKKALRHGPSGKVLIFANSPAMAESAYQDAALEIGEDSCALFHKNVMMRDRIDRLAAFDRGDLRALVCTGMASRGLDFVDVAHVIQYEVALNAVEFMHRIGRTARAGKAGAATTFYTEDRAVLIEGIRDALAEGRQVDEFFSRSRSFTLQRKKKEKKAREALAQTQN